MSEVIKVFISSSQHNLLWTLVQYDCANCVYNIIDGAGSASEKTNKIVNQLDFLFEIRVALAQLPAQGGQVTLDTLARAYLSALLDNVIMDLLSPDLRATFPQEREELQMKLGDLKSGFLLSYIRKTIGAS